MTSTSRKDGLLLLFTLSEQRCALPLANIERVVRVAQILPLPKAPEIVMGVINFQGRAIPVLNIRRLFGLPEIELALSDQMIFARTSRRPVAILVQGTMGVAGFREEDVIASEELFPGIEYLNGVVKLKDGIAYIYDLDKFLSLDDEAAIDSVLSSSFNTPEGCRDDA